MSDEACDKCGGMLFTVDNWRDNEGGCDRRCSNCGAVSFYRYNKGKAFPPTLIVPHDKLVKIKWTGGKNDDVTLTRTAMRWYTATCWALGGFAMACILLNGMAVVIIGVAIILMIPFTIFHLASSEFRL